MDATSITPNLKEIGGRLSKLSYREMQTLASHMGATIDVDRTLSVRVGEDKIIEALLGFSDAAAHAEAVASAKVSIGDRTPTFITNTPRAGEAVGSRAR